MGFRIKHVFWSSAKVLFFPREYWRSHGFGFGLTGSVRVSLMNVRGGYRYSSSFGYTWYGSEGQGVRGER